jgi:hypothetical protein
MDINKMLAELRDEREGIEQAIMVLQRLSAGQQTSGTPTGMDVRDKSWPEPSWSSSRQ